MSWPLRWAGQGQPKVRWDQYEQGPAGGCAKRIRAVLQASFEVSVNGGRNSRRYTGRHMLCPQIMSMASAQKVDNRCVASERAVRSSALAILEMFPRRGSRPALGCQTWARARRVTCKHDSPTPPGKIVVTKRPTRGRYIRCHSDKNRYYT